ERGRGGRRLRGARQSSYLPHGPPSRSALQGGPLPAEGRLQRHPSCRSGTRSLIACTVTAESRPAATSSTSMFSPAPSTKVMDSVIGGQRELADLWRHWLTPDGEPSPCPGALLRAHRSVLARLLPEH